MELKGLRGKAIRAADNIGRLNRAYDAFNEAAPAHASDVESLTPQIEELGSDLTFAAQTLGNSVGGGDVSPPAPPKVEEKPIVNSTDGSGTTSTERVADRDVGDLGSIVKQAAE